MNIVYFFIGNSMVINMQVAFSIRTFLAQMTKDDTIYVVTDTPLMYADLPQTVTIPVTQDDIKRWKGKHNFFFRVKIEVLRMIARKDPEKAMIYLDGDTYLYGPLSEIKERLSNGQGLMHKDEGCPGDMKDESLKMWQTYHDRTYGGITITTRHHMWNAGVVAIPGPLVEKVTDLALEVCDGMLDDNSEPFVVEQYSLSVALFELCKDNMVEAKSWIGHYWHYKYYWSRYIAKFFVKAYSLNYTIDEQLEKIRQTDLAWVHKRLLVKRTLAKFLGMIH